MRWCGRSQLKSSQSLKLSRYGYIYTTHIYMPAVPVPVDHAPQSKTVEACLLTRSHIARVSQGESGGDTQGGGRQRGREYTRIYKLI